MITFQNDLNRSACTILGATKDNYEAVVLVRCGSKRNVGV